MKHLIMGTAGHVDHGKTALIKALTGKDCDTHKEEKQRGITINLGFSYLNLPGGESVGVIDVPGHKDFIITMVGGACGIDFVMLVIAADSGIMPQTIEHINIINSLGVKKGIVALTKADLVDEELLEIAKMEISEFLEKTSLENAPVIAVSSITGKGIDELKSEIEKLISNIEEKEESGNFRMYIDRIFTVKGFGSVVTGSVMSGTVATEQEVFLLPGNHQKLRVRSIERHGKHVDKVFAGDRAAINLIGLNVEDFKRGMIISDKNLKETSMFDASITLFDNTAILPLWSQVTFHSGTFESLAKVHNLNLDISEQGKEIIAQIHLDRPAILLNKDKFIIRNSSGDKTLGGGYVIDPSPLHHKKRTVVVAENLNLLSETLTKGGNTGDLIRIELKKEFRPFLPDEIVERLHLKTDDLKEILNGDDNNFAIYRSAENIFLVDHDFNDKFIQKIIKIIADYHKEFPLFPGAYDTNELAGKLSLSKNKNDKVYLGLLLLEMEQKGLVEKYKSTWIIKGHKPTIDARSKEEIAWIENAILEFGTQLPVIADVEEKAVENKIPKHKVKVYLTLLAMDGKITTFQNECIHSNLTNEYRKVLLGMLANNENGISINEFKDRINGTKRFCAVLLGIFENEKIIKTIGTGVDTKIFITPSGKNIK